jgi:hypothetical protein
VIHLSRNLDTRDLIYFVPPRRQYTSRFLSVIDMMKQSLEHVLIPILNHPSVPRRARIFHPSRTNTLRLIPSAETLDQQLVGRHLVFVQEDGHADAAGWDAGFEMRVEEWDTGRHALLGRVPVLWVQVELGGH